MKRFIFPPEMKLTTIWIVWLFLAIGSLGGALFVLLDAFDAKKDAAAWVQAVGSVAAILIAIWMANKQSQERIEIVRKQENELLKKIYGVAKYAAQVSVNTFVYINQEHPEAAIVRKFLGALRECEILSREVSFTQVPLSEVALGWLELRHAISDVRDHTERYLEDPAFDNRDRYYMELAKNRAINALRRMAEGAGTDVPEILATI
ncbi:hypothetical protein NJC08_08415 [Pseudomonas fluorescens]|uniref:hypothetical protein n=1 Tax=Pseudomonas fluorescens TaxID=294 RepID=UPI00209B7AA4|nr:hypothetical protein [Pseudomonas fluorescens]MCO7626434.1 hypothetical protein [Pseudomonas fluorescens]